MARELAKALERRHHRVHVPGATAEERAWREARVRVAVVGVETEPSEARRWPEALAQPEPSVVWLVAASFPVACRQVASGTSCSPNEGAATAGGHVFRDSGYYFLALLGAAVAAFWPKYIARPAAEIDAYTHLHAVVMVAWCALLIAQPFLIRARRQSVHRVLGVVSYFVAPAVVVASLLLAHHRFRSMDDSTFAAEARNLYLPLSAVALFAIAYGCGVLFRRKPELHARFMVCTSLTMIDPVVGRILAFYVPPLPGYLYYQAITYGLTDLILLHLAIRDRARPHTRWAFGVMLLVFLAAHALWFTWAQAEGWVQVARWFRAVPLT